MRINRFFAAFAMFIVIVINANSVSACYSPTSGRWLQQDSEQYINGSNLYEYTGNNPIVRVDPTGNDFIAVADRPINVAGGFNPFYHYSLEYWSTSNEDDRPASETVVSLWAGFTAGARKVDSIELLNNTWYSDIVGGTSTNVSVVYYNEDSGTSFVAIDYGVPCQVNEHWTKLKKSAQAYGFAEQSNSGVLGAQHWPNSHYETSLGGNNSNTFVRTIVPDAGLPMIELGGWHPGAYSPHTINYWPDGVKSPPWP